MRMLNSIAIEFDLEKKITLEIPLEQIQISSKDKNKIYWIHCDLEKKTLFSELAEKLHLPDELIQMCLHEDTTKKTLELDDTLTIQVSDLLDDTSEKSEPFFGNLIIHLTEQFCFTASYEPLMALLKFRDECQKNVRYALTSGFILFLILDNVIYDYSTTLQEYEFMSDGLDMSIRKMHKGTYGEVLNLKNKMVKIRRNLIALRDILMRISSHKISVISEPCRLSLSDLLDHVQMNVNEMDSLRDILNSILDFIDNSLMQKINKSIGLIKAIAAVFLPLSIITGLYTMNFHWLLAYQWKPAYIYPLAFILIAIAGVLMIIKKREKTL